jgi:hypothetical protein
MGRSVRWRAEADVFRMQGAALDKIQQQPIITQHGAERSARLNWQRLDGL